MREVRVIEIRVSTSESPPLVVLAEVGGAERLLPIWTSHGGASAIFGATEDPDPLRPTIHDLAAELAEAAPEPMLAAQITAFDDGQFFAELVFESHTMPARASDAIALALRVGCPIQCAEELLDAVGVDSVEEVADLAAGEDQPDDEVERFREFLDTVTPEDFTGDEGKP